MNDYHLTIKYGFVVEVLSAYMYNMVVYLEL